MYLHSVMLKIVLQFGAHVVKHVTDIPIQYSCYNICNSLLFMEAVVLLHIGTSYWKSGCI